MNAADLIHDWNRTGSAFDWPAARFDLNDETLRDGLQCPSVKDPSMEQKVRLLHLMADLGIVAADIGLPGAGPRVREQVTVLAREIVKHKLPIAPNCAARTHLNDVQPIVDISQAVGIPIEAATFIGSSPIRQYAEDWTLDRMLQVSEEAVTFAVKNGLPVMFVTEDTTRARPETLKALYGNAIRWGARRLCLADTVGHATPEGVRALIRFVREEIIAPSKEDVKLDWHGHRDRGMGVINLHLLGAYRGDLRKLPEYCHLVSEALGRPIGVDYPVMGADAFRTGTGVHAAAIVKARAKGDDWLADRVYSSVPAGELGMAQRIEISPVSGLSNVKYWLQAHGYDPANESAARTLFDAAKKTDRVLTDDECHALLASAGA
jgi:2-isopropylmalate synthase